MLKEMGPCFWWSFFNFTGQWEHAARTSPCPPPSVFESTKKQAPSEGKAGECQPRSCCLPCWRLVLPGRFAGKRARAYRLSFCAQEQAGSLPQACLPSHTAAVSVLWEPFPPRRSHRGRWWSFLKGALTHTVGICVTGKRREKPSLGLEHSKTVWSLSESCPEVQLPNEMLCVVLGWSHGSLGSNRLSPVCRALWDTVQMTQRRCDSLRLQAHGRKAVPLNSFHFPRKSLPCSDFRLEMIIALFLPSDAGYTEPLLRRE